MEPAISYDQILDSKPDGPKHVFIEHIGNMDSVRRSDPEKPTDLDRPRQFGETLGACSLHAELDKVFRLTR